MPGNHDYLFEIQSFDFAIHFACYLVAGVIDLQLAKSKEMILGRVREWYYAFEF